MNVYLKVLDAIVNKPQNGHAVANAQKLSEFIGC